MENRKIQELVAKFKAKNNEPLTVNSAEQDVKSTTLEEPADVQDGDEESTVGYPNEYFEIVEGRGQPFNGEEIGLGYNDWFKVKVNYDKVVADFGKNVVLCFYGFSRLHHTLFSIYSAKGEEFIGNYHYSDLYNKRYEVQLDKIFEKTGSADFIFKAKWDGIETLILDKCAIYSGVCFNDFQISRLEIAKQPDKTAYKEGEPFDCSGMTVVLYSSDGFVNEILDYDFYPKRGLEIEDKHITISFQDVSCDLPITVGPKYIYVETMPTQMRYMSGETFNPMGMVVKKVYYDGVEETITDYTLSDTKITLSNKTVTITYKHLSTQLTVDIYGQRITASAEIQETTNGLNWRMVGSDRICFDKVYSNEQEKETRTVVKINKKDINFGNFKSANLTLNLFTDKNTADEANFYVNGKLYRKQADSNRVFINLGVVEASHDGDIELTFSYYNAPYEFCFTGDLEPVIYVSPVASAGTEKILKEFPIGESAKAYVDLNTGATTSAVTSFSADDFAMPLNITHLHNKLYEASGYGDGWRLNLQKKLKVSDDDDFTNTKFVYTDEFGDTHDFEEKYYYTVNGAKVFVAKNKVEIDLNGNLYFTDSSGVKKEIKKQQKCGGYTLIPEINDFKNCELIEQKISEQVELENFVNSYEPSLKSYVKVNSKNGEIVGEMGSLTKSEYETLIAGVDKDSENIVVSTSEALQLQSLYSNLSQLFYQSRMLLLQKDQTKVQSRQMEAQIKQSEQQYKDLSQHVEIDWARYREDLSVGFNEIPFMKDRDPSKKHENDEKYSFAKAYVAFNSNKVTRDLLKNYGDEDEVYGIIPDMEEQKYLLNRLIKEYDEQGDNCAKQITLVLSQRDFIISQARANFEVIKETFIKYFTKKAQLDLLVLQTPVNYLKDLNGIVNGFNKNGDLVCLFDSFGNSVALEYDNQMRIKSAYDSNGKVVSFEYANDLLSGITDSIGRTVKYGYDKGKLIKVVYPNGNGLDISYSGDGLSSLTYSEGMQYEMSYSGGLLAELTANRIKPVSGTVSDIILNYILGEKVYILYDNGDNELYEFNDKNKLSAYSKSDGTQNRTKTTYTYSNNDKTITETSYDESDGLHITTTKNYDDSDMLLSEAVDWQRVSDTVRVKTETAFSYDSDSKPIRKTVTKYIDNLGTITTKQSVTNYNYNAQNILVLVEEYVVGEEATSGKNYVQSSYDENGKATKTVSWNSLDSSTKFYSENVTAENGQLTAEKDSTGEVCAEYEYIDGTNVVNSVKYPNGSKISYGRNPYDMTVTSVTQSTKSGISNQTDIVYEHGMPVKVKSGNTEIDYVYDAKGRKTSVNIDGKLYSSYSYEDYRRISDKQVNLGKASQTLYDGTDSIKSVYSKTGVWDDEANAMICEETFTVGGDTLCRTHYLTNGNTDYILYRDSVGNKALNYEYDSFNNLTKVSTLSDTQEIMTESYTYNEYGELTGISFTGEADHSYTFNYEDKNERKISSIEFGEYGVKPLSDIYGRNTGKEIYSGNNKIAGEYISYRKVGDHATNMPATVWFGNGANIKDSIKYKYDKCGNICEISENGSLKVRYTYDSLNRLIREDNKIFNETYLYDYDNNGNILNKRVTMFTLSSSIEQQDFETYIYGYNGDRLVDYNGETFKYNNLGNPVIYRGKTVEWQYGKWLIKLGSTEFTYDGLGRRTSKGGITFTYDNEGRLIKQSNGLEFIYDHTGVVGIIHNGTQYFYRKDVQGNIIAILDGNGNVVVRYAYDAWGNHTVTAEEKYLPLANANPFRYRSYYFDTETGLYFLQTRYYDPELGRFISQDSIEYADPITVNGLNLYAYCGDNPVMRTDGTGTDWWSDFWKGVGNFFSAAGRFLGGLALTTTFAAVFFSILPIALFSPVETLLCEFSLTMGFYGAALMGSVFPGTVYSDMEKIHWNPYNLDAGATAASETMSFYKGIPVIRANKVRSGTLGIMLLERGETANTVKHEFGHIPQLMILGVGNFLLTVGLPSWKKWGVPKTWEYYDSPWEAMAEMFGGASSDATPLTKKETWRAINYLIISLFVGPFVHSFYRKL